ncbi:hypothetical protein C8J57DRAFT_1052379 [Mycena rebaudengoi]|nr:hypothetical protein C8J57DRAFT_1052379 [Mycena rebaudengoi]
MRKPPPGWTESSGSRSLAAKIPTVLSSRTRSLDKTTFDADVTGAVADEAEDSESGEGYVPGTFVEIRRNEVSTHGVVLGEVNKDSRWHVVALVSTGEVWDPLRDDIMFSVPSLVTPDMAQRCSHLEIAVEKSQLNARIAVLQRIRQIERAVEAATAEISRKGLKVYNQVKSVDANTWATTTVTEVARLISPRPTLVTIFAAHKYLMDNPQNFVASHAYRFSQSFDVRPQAHIKIIKTIEAWCRQPDSPLADFVKRANPIIAANKRLLAQHRDEKPSQRPAKHAWTPEDIVILTFLQHGLRPSRSTQTDPYNIGLSAILHRLDPNVVVNDHEVHMTLVNLGVYAPWQDLHSLRRDLDLDQEDPKTSSLAKATDALVQRSLSTPPRSGPLGPEDFHAKDPLDHLRHDFGNMRVYVLDDLSAEELDDGVSVEAIPGEPESYWIHVHIADPASTIPPTHVLAQRAERQSQTAYFIHRSWPLIPKSLMFSGRNGFSLTPQMENRVLTFSSKINSSGELVGHVVRPGIVRNLVKVSYDEVDVALTGNIMPRFYPFSPAPPPPATPSLSDEQIDDLRLLTKLRARLVKNRFDKGVFESTRETPRIRHFETPTGIHSPTMQPSEFRGFPNFSYFVTQSYEEASGSRGLVAEAMKLACRCASRWCTERGIDVIRRASPALEATPGALEQLRRLRSEEGFIDATVIASLASSMPSAEYTLRPGAHWTLGVQEGEGYTRATSPLRRFSDLLVHYQMHSSLLGTKPHFSAGYLQDYMVRLKCDDRLKRRTESLHIRFWVLMALKRWMEAPRYDMPDPLVNLRAILTHPARFNVVDQELNSEVRIPALGITATLTGVPAEALADWKVASSVPVKIKEIKLGVRPTLTVALV